MVLYLLLLILCVAQLKAEDGELESFEPFEFELETNDEIGFTSNHKHALIGTEKPETLTRTLPSLFPINHNLNDVAKIGSLIPESAKLKSATSQEFQTDNVPEKANTERLITSTEFTLNRSANTTTSLCDNTNDIPTFIKHPRVIHKSPPKLSHKMESLKDCAQNCRKKMSLDREEPFDCHGFSFLGRYGDNKCEFYETHLFEYSPIEKRDDHYNYFERVCLTIPHDCANSAYSFEIQPAHLLSATPLKEHVVENRKQCLDLCLSIQGCKSVNYNKSNGTCLLLDSTSQIMMGLSEDLEFDYYENMCIRDRQRCENGYRTDFVVTRATQVSSGEGLDINLGSLSIGNCMRECIESTLIFCRSFQYDSTRRECMLIEETGLNGVKSDQYDLYEPLCLNNEIDVPCPGDRVFERIPRTNLISEESLSNLKDVTLSSCMEACLFDENCVSFTYHRPERRCKLLPLNRRNNQTVAVVETSIDYYELACDRNAILKTPQVLSETVSPDLLTTRQPTTTKSDKQVNFTITKNLCDLSQSVIIESGRTLRIDYRNLHHVNVHSLDRCQTLCAQAAVKCATFAYNKKTADCLLSSTSIDKNNKFMLVTQLNPNFDLYSFLGASACLFNSTSTTTESIKETSTIGEITATTFLSDPFEIETRSPISSTLSTHPTLISLVIPTTPRQLKDPKLEPIFDIQIEPKQITKQLPVFTTPSQITRRPTEKPRELTTEKSFPIEAVISSSSHVLPHRDKTIERLPTNKIAVTATCLDSGVNVTFKIEGSKYTGAVYAAERFAQCRIFVEARSEFSIFVTRPSVNNFCNALEENGELTAVLVMSNDMVLPYDVTTKDDFFYQITCDYTKGEQNSLIKTGIVVGGLEPKSVMSSSKKSEEKQNRVFLKILKNQRPVTKVYIGEKLTAVVESDLDADRLRITDCNATRVGGQIPRPNSVQLIKDGCSVMPQIMGNIVRGPLGLEAPFTAFRIDGSDQIDIICGIIVCKQRCEEKLPKCSENRNKRSNSDENSEMIIDQRLQVLVDDRQPTTDPSEIRERGEPQSLLHMILDMNSARTTQYCMNPLVVLIMLSMFLLILVAFVITLAILLCKRRTLRFPYHSNRLGLLY